MFRWLQKPMEVVWEEYATQWKAARRVLGGSVGPYFVPAKEHRLCERFVRRFPGARDFLYNKLQSGDPILAAYAFKCLIRMTNVNRSDMPPESFNRTDEIGVQQLGCCERRMTLGQYFDEYFCDLEELFDLPQQE